MVVQLVISTKGKVNSIVRNCKILLNDFITRVNVNILTLGSYDMLIGMNSLEEDNVLLNCFDKTFIYIDNNGNNIKVKGIPRKVTIKEIFDLQSKRSIRKGCKVFVVYIMNDKETYIKPKLEDITVLNEFEDIFLEEVLVLPPKNRYRIHD